MPDMVPVDSSNLASVGYDPDSRDLHVRFKSGATHRYAGVSAEHHAGLMASDSKGKYFHANIRNAYPSEKVDG